MTLKEQIGEWQHTLLLFEFTKKYMARLSAIIQRERKRYTVYPSSENVFRAYRTCPPDKVSVVILGQDPYPHEAADGLAFSAKETLGKIPPSLRNIFKEVEQSIGFQAYHNPDLERWSRQGVLLLNTKLTVREGKPGSHNNIGWERFTGKTLDIINDFNRPVVFMMWGKDAQKHIHRIDQKKHKILCTSHPSPFSVYRGFCGCDHFAQANKFLGNNRKIDWRKNEI